MALKRKRTRGVEIPTASLADIAFLLLVFFLFTTTIDTDKGISLALPEKGETKEVSKKNITNILINANGQVLFQEQQLEIRLIRDRVRQTLLENPNMIFSVKTDRATKYDVYIDVLDQLKQANATRISIAEPES